VPLVEPVIRPPSEAESFLLQVTTGCSSNSCTFCGAYMGKPFRTKDRGEIESDIEEWSRLAPETRRVFLLDGDALAAGRDLLVPVLEKVNSSFPRLRRIASYANGDNVTALSDRDLRELADLKLRHLTIGLESGSQEVLNRCRKRASAVEMTAAVRRADGAGIRASVIVLLGLGGRDLRGQHVEETITVLNRMQPRNLSFLTLMLVPGTVLHRQAGRGEFALPRREEMLREAEDIVSGLELRATTFRSDHASNYLPLEGRFPKDKEALLGAIRSALEGARPLRAEFRRGL
jgi:radical SAM superfamily enzyme YgiQ (UPF0313 family)